MGETRRHGGMRGASQASCHGCWLTGKLWPRAAARVGQRCCDTAPGQGSAAGVSVASLCTGTVTVARYCGETVQGSTCDFILRPRRTGGTSTYLDRYTYCRMPSSCRLAVESIGNFHSIFGRLGVWMCGRRRNSCFDDDTTPLRRLTVGLSRDLSHDFGGAAGRIIGAGGPQRYLTRPQVPASRCPQRNATARLVEKTDGNPFDRSNFLTATLISKFATTGLSSHHCACRCELIARSCWRRYRPRRTGTLPSAGLCPSGGGKVPLWHLYGAGCAKPSPSTSSVDTQPNRSRREPSKLRQRNADRRETARSIYVEAALSTDAALKSPIPPFPALRERPVRAWRQRAVSSLSSPRARNVSPQRPASLAASRLAAYKQQPLFASPRRWPGAHPDPGRQHHRVDA